MLGKTHLAVGVASALAVVKPETIPLVITTVGAGALGGIIPDIDVDTTDAHEGATFVTVASVLAIGAVAALDKLYGTGIVNRLMSDQNRWRTILAGLGFIGVCAVGKGTRHRSFMHSFLALAILSALIGILLPQAMMGFAVGYASHLVIDILNRKGEQLLFPIQKRFCLDVCDSNGVINKLLFYVGVAITILLIIQMYLLKFI